MGALPYPGGVTFRLWAPFASVVAVAGTFNRWSPVATPLSSEGHDYWSVDVAGAAVRDQYKFVITNPGLPAPLWKNDPYARELTNSVGNSVVADPDYIWQSGGYSTPAWNELVIYELHVGSFLFDAANNKRGDFDTVASKLDYLADLGVNAVQVMAADEFPLDVSWGYNPSYIFAIESSYGGPNGFRKLVDAAHARGIAVIFDVVYNHLGPDDLDLWRFDGWTPNNRPEEGGIYFYNDWRRKTDWGDTRPDYGRGEVRQYIRDNALRWLEQRYCDGLRLDATGWIRNVWGSNTDHGADLPDGWSLMQWINTEVKSRQPWKIVIAEDMQDNDWITKDVGAGGAGFAAQWGAGFMHTVRGVVTASGDAGRSMPALRSVIDQCFNGEAFQRVIYTESHDEAGHDGRVPEVIWPGNADSFFSRKRSTLAAALVFTAPGIPMIFMGQEFLEWGRWTDAEQLDWSKATRFQGIWTLYRDLIRLRRNWFDTTRGLKGQRTHVHHVNDNDKVIAFHRWDRGGPRDDVVVLLNFANRSYPAYQIGLPRAGRWHIRLNSDWSGYSTVFGNQASFDLSTDAIPSDSMPVTGAVGLGAYSAVILSQDD
jgi:1,4-alpha-glucan branching enzyme